MPFNCLDLFVFHLFNADVPMHRSEVLGLMYLYLYLTFNPAGPFALQWRMTVGVLTHGPNMKTNRDLT